MNKQQIESRLQELPALITEAQAAIKKTEADLKSLQETKTELEKELNDLITATKNFEQVTPELGREMENLPEILTAQHIATYLTISRRRVYELFQIKPEFGGIPNFEIGASKRVDKEDFKDWIEARKKEKSAKC
jgi:chromosome segregation ATPase